MKLALRCWMARVTCAWGVAALAACASAPTVAPVAYLLQDHLLPAPAMPIVADEVMSPNDEMKRFAARLRGVARKGRDLRQVFIDALYDPKQLRLQYDSSATRTAAQAFDARAGNCLSLVLMTGALAKELGLQVSYQSVLGEDSFSRDGATVFASGHVNLVLAQPVGQGRHLVNDGNRELTIDFMPQEQLAGQRVAPIHESTVRAMFMNNRAAESLSQGDTEQGYWWAREALQQDSSFLPAINTLAVVYIRRGHLALAERALRHALSADRNQTSVLANLVRVLEHSGRPQEAAATAARLADLQPVAPFRSLDQGREALVAGDPVQARKLITAELRRQPFQHEVHFWLAVAHHQLGDHTRAARHLALAAEYATTRATHDLYAAKLASLRNSPRGQVLQ